MTEDFSSMSDEEKRGYLKALGIDPYDLGGAPSEADPKPRPSREGVVSVEKGEFSRDELFLLREKGAKIKGALSVAFHEVLRAAFVDVEVGGEVTVKARLRTGSRPLNPLSVREAIKTGLEPHLLENGS